MTEAGRAAIDWFAETVEDHFRRKRMTTELERTFGLSPAAAAAFTGMMMGDDEIAAAPLGEHPGLIELVGRLAESGPESIGIQDHLAGCGRCRALLTSPWLRSRARLITTGQRTWDQVRSMLRDALTGRVEGPLPAPAFAAETRLPFVIRLDLAGGEETARPVTVTLRETDDQRFVVHLESGDAELSGRHALVEILGPGEPLTARVEMRKRPGGGSAGRHDFGAFPEVAPRVSPVGEILVALTE